MKSLEDRLDEAAEDYTKVEKIMADLRKVTDECGAAAQKLLDAEQDAVAALEALAVPGRSIEAMVGDMIAAMDEVRSKNDAGLPLIAAQDEMISLWNLEENVHAEYEDDVLQAQIDAAEYAREARAEARGLTR